MMDTRLKRIALPTPSLLSLTKNFNDGSHSTDENAHSAPTFISLGLDNDLELETNEPLLTNRRLDAEQPRQVEVCLPFKRCLSLTLLSLGISCTDITFSTSPVDLEEARCPTGSQLFLHSGGHPFLGCLVQTADVAEQSESKHLEE